MKKKKNIGDQRKVIKTNSTFNSESIAYEVVSCTLSLMGYL